MSRIRPHGRVFAVVLLVLAFGVVGLGQAEAARAPYRIHQRTGVGSCTLKGFNPTYAGDLADLPIGHRRQT
jgi:hypothetical protein